MMLMPIGSFARASRLSIKTLRTYDASGLLQAAFVDPHSGYRYYRLEQLGLADKIRTLRALDFPLARIAQIVLGDEAESALQSHLVALQLQRDEYDRKLSDLRILIARGEFEMSQEVIVKTLRGQAAASYRTSTTLASVFTDIPEGFGRVLAALAVVGSAPVGAPFTVFHRAPDADSVGDIALCVPIADAVRVPHAIEITRFKDVVAATIVHQGAYENMGESYATVAAWIHRHGHRVVGPTREVYLNSPADVETSALLTEIQFPIEPDETD